MYITMVYTQPHMMPWKSSDSRRRGPAGRALELLHAMSRDSRTEQP